MASAPTITAAMHIVADTIPIAALSGGYALFNSSMFSPQVGGWVGV